MGRRALSGTVSAAPQHGEWVIASRAFRCGPQPRVIAKGAAQRALRSIESALRS